MQNSDFGVSNQTSSSFSNIRVIHKVTLSLDLFSPSIPCFLEDVKSAKEIECSHHKSKAAIFSPSLPFAPFEFSKANWVIPGHVLDS
jgi:hypothetical protein